MSLSLVSAAAAEPVTLVEAKAFLNVTTADDDTLITSLIAAARAEIDGEDGWLGRALVTQTWDLLLDRFPGGSLRNPWSAIFAPLPPLQSVTSLKYLDTAGVEQTLATAKYTVDAKSEPGRIVPAYGESWPSTRDVPNAVTLRFVAGYGAAAAVAEPLKRWIKSRVATLYGFREPVVVGTITSDIETVGDEAILSYRVWGP